MSTIVSMQDWLDQHQENSEADERLFLSEEQVQSFPQFKDACIGEIQNIINTLHDLALVSYELFSREAKKDNELNKAA